MELFILSILAISLSMDAFSMSLAYGTLKISKKDIIILSTIVGCYHFVMPLIGNILGNLILQKIPINPSYLVFFILVIIGIEMIVDTLTHKQSIDKINIIKMFLFGFTVSIDSFSLGIGINNITSNILLAALLFTIFSFLFTFLGSTIGSKINQIFGPISTMIGGIILILVAILYIL